MGYDTTMNKHNQNGSAHVIAVSLLTVALLGALGWIFWQNFLQPKPEQQSAKNTGSSQQVSPSPKIQADTLALSEWKVRFTITGELKQAGIEAQKETGPTTLEDGSEGTYTHYYVTTSRQRAFGQLTSENVDKLCDAGSGVTVVQSKNLEDENDRQLTAKPIGGFYYRWSIPSAGGCDGPDTKAIVSALKSLEVAN